MITKKLNETIKALDKKDKERFQQKPSTACWTQRKVLLP